MLPTDTKDDRPSPRRPAASMIAIPRPPLWDMNPIEPGSACRGAKVALRRTLSVVLRTPRQFGPTILMPAARQTSSNWRWRSAPASPASANPELITRSARTPARAQSRAAARTSSAGTTTTARSTGQGMSITDL